MQKHILGFPRIGKKRELKKTLELFWQSEISIEDLNQTSAELRKNHWNIQKNAGLSSVATGDFSLYDHVLDTTMMLGIIPERFKELKNIPETDLYFKMAQGDAKYNIPAMEMTKWFNTNYHYIVPELSKETKPKLTSINLIAQTKEAIKEGFIPKPVLVGPITYLSLAKSSDGSDKWKHLESIVDIYVQVLSELKDLCQWIQIDEPILCSDMEKQAAGSFVDVYKKLSSAAGDSLLLTTYFDKLDDNLQLALDSGCKGLHIDITSDSEHALKIANQIPDNMMLSIGIINGRNIWKADISKSADILKQISEICGKDRLMISSSCSLIHSPVDVSTETSVDTELRNWMSFAVQKCSEISLLGDILEGKDKKQEIELNASIIKMKETSKRINSETVRNRVLGIDESMYHRKSPYSERKMNQNIGLPLFPTTTIGSFPQTPEIRQKRNSFKKGNIFFEEYSDFMKNNIHRNIRMQEEMGLDVLVHGEPERNDMVEYFGQKMNGFCFTSNGWVQSYGSRCVKPPIIYGDISRRGSMTLSWIKYAQSLTVKPVKGILTGPVTMMCWSFVREDITKEELCTQLALAIRDEVIELEKSGIRIIQIDEAAFSEGMPIKKRDKDNYLNQAVKAFRLCSSGVKDSTQIHTHMCYSEFNNIINAIADMDADVISIESSRSNMELINAFKDYEYPNDIGPGVYDIHSSRVPSKDEIKKLILKALDKIPKEKLWINPDCGLKTRRWEETEKALNNMIQAAKEIRTVYS